MATETNQRVTQAIGSYLAGRKMSPIDRQAPEVLVERVDRDGRQIDVTLTFRKGEYYCCAEPGCHLSLIGSDDWSRLRLSMHQLGIEVGAPIKLRARGIVEKGALLESASAFGLSEVVERFEYEVEFREDRSGPPVDLT